MTKSDTGSAGLLDLEIYKFEFRCVNRSLMPRDSEDSGRGNTD